MKKLIIFLIRKRLGLNANEHFRFANQKSKYDEYFFLGDTLWKVEYDGDQYQETRPASVSLNWLLGDYCAIIKEENYDR